MAAIDPMDHLKELGATLTGIEAVMDLDVMRRDIAELRDQAADPDLWSDQEHAQTVTRRLSSLESELGKVEALRGRLEDLEVLYEMAAEEDDADTRAEADTEREALAGEMRSLEVRTLMSGEYDAREALVSINAQAGGVDAAAFSQQLQRMYLRWAERHGYSTEIYETSFAEEAGIKSTTFAVKAPYAYGTLRGEHGTHRMVRISAYDNQGRRQTSFAGVDIVPVVEQSDHVDINEDDLRIDVYRSSGPGGQGVNTTDSAVRITHLPTGIVVSCQNERSQLQNRASAMNVLQAKLLERKRQEEADELNKLRGEGTSSWGTQIRSYVVHPYQMVKDLRTLHEEGNPERVLDGWIDDFLEAEIRWLRKAEAGEPGGL
ncbi:peptide chain release factor 2 [Actinocorallia sp. API 0066]|uniref:peptide chain release factor 2 n=1 Tax=Actinocorallia sp. API 0066 TaxID=2896846 RepID=UPI001E47068B|nr:peptide chain release factor 2 [Actinocorallia sp. API 0066]MCD0451243.1 peptide chain release factor 2 [Actinocorallia sp. API 0066]